jgi:hypothetical protein
MGILSNYGELKSAVAVYAKRNNANFTASIPIFIRSAHDRLMRDLDASLPLLNASATITIDAEVVAMPADFRAVTRLAIEDAYDAPLSPTSMELRQRATVRGPGRPQVFAPEAGGLAFGPAPNGSYTGKLLYRRALEMFTTDLSSNVLLQRYPLAYLYGALAEAYGFDKFDEDQTKYITLFSAEIDAINAAERKRAGGGGALAPAPSGYAV